MSVAGMPAAILVCAGRTDAKRVELWAASATDHLENLKLRVLPHCTIGEGLGSADNDLLRMLGH